MRLKIAIIATGLLSLGACGDQAGGAGARDQVRVVGSSTVYPFATLVAEQFRAENPGLKAPVVEETGTGAGIKLFCKGVGAAHPDILDASRRMTAKEFSSCEANNVGPIMEIQIGLDGITFAEAKNGPKLQLIPADIYAALAANPMGQPNKAKTWKDVNPALPAIPIQVYGPPSTSGTRTALAEILMQRGCQAVYPESLKLKDKEPDKYRKICEEIRSDGPYIDAGENDNLIVQKLQANPNAVGIFGYSYLEQNLQTLAGVPIGGVAPTYETVAQGRYPGSRPLYIYVKKAHLNAVQGLAKFIAVYPKMWNPGGPLVKRGLIAAPQNVRDAAAKVIENGTVLDMSNLE
ncbi:substrate-binding domain-containing protein [Sphingomonas sp.]|uniref:substrate-binding domain-containing protein n=1 Tax=Sphingomonas sp. TaxID=28214 RepID=UPI001DB5E871|nr:substrate-binding domain-containing protein [Sphingomonas sp.]MBX9795804.1 substrate-binding domain-containing protein [Sphingomonas sp.]